MRGWGRMGSRVQVVGAGAVGSYYGALLARDGHEVTLVTRGPHLEALRAQGALIVREAGGSTWRVPVRAEAAPVAGAELVIVATKSHHTLAAAGALAPVLAPDTPVLSLQNGVENVARLASVVGGHRVLGGIAFVGLSHHHTRHRRSSGSRVGALRRSRRPHDRSARQVMASSSRPGMSPLVGRHRPRPVAQAAVERRLQCGVRHLRCHRRPRARHPRTAVAWCAPPWRRWWRWPPTTACTLTEAEVDGMAAYDAQLRDYRPSTAQDVAAGKRLERDALCGFNRA